jgi:hypothetical protein
VTRQDILIRRIVRGTKPRCHSGALARLARLTAQILLNRVARNLHYTLNENENDTRRIVLSLGAAVALPARAQERESMQTIGDKLLAIDVLLEADQTMIGMSRAVNARLRENYAAWYELDATHAPHVTLRP